MVVGIEAMAKQACSAARILATADTEAKNTALRIIADQLLSASDDLLAANAIDLQAGRDKGLSAALLDRLTLNQDRITAMCEGLHHVATLDDPVGKTIDMPKRPSGIRVGTRRVPIGVIGIIYESRPNVTADAAGLCLKSGNAVILRGGSEALYSNCAIADCIHQALAQTDLPVDCIQIVRTSDRRAVTEMLVCDRYIDVIIPRGGKSLVEKITTESRIPVIKHLDGVCHVFVDRDADLDKALAIAVNAKTHRYGVCNAMETLLVDADIAADFLPQVAQAFNELNVELRVCEPSRHWIPSAQSATDEDWYTEYLAPVLSIKVVPDVQAAIEHIEHYGSHHTDAIVTENTETMKTFVNQVDSSSVMVNVSTRFADGFEYGLGAEIGISTGKLHARGPVGLEGLTTYKYVVFGEGQIRT